MIKKREKHNYVKAAKRTKEERKAKQKKSPVFAPNTKGRLVRGTKKVLGILLMLLGALTLTVMTIRSHHYGTGWSFTHYFYMLVLAAGMVLYLSFVKEESRMARFRYYRSFLEEKEYMLLSEIENMTGRKRSFLQKDFARMIREKLFLQANMNREGTCLFLTKDAFDRYKRGQLILTAEVKSEAEKEVFESEKNIIEQEDPQPKQEDPQPKWEDLLHSINSMSGQITNPNVMKPVSDICIRGQQILYFKDTTMSKEVERFLNYYLPVTNTVLTTYKALKSEGLEDQAADLIVILNTIQHSFDSFVEKLIEGKRVDVEEDIAAVEMMLSNS